jgi:hypothetical protein
MTEHEIEQLNARVIATLGRDPFLSPFWSGMPECNVFPYLQSDHLKELLVTVFLKESVINRGTVAMVVSRIAKLVQPEIQSVEELRILAGWVGGGDSSDRYFRVIRFAVRKEALESPILQSLAQHLSEESFKEGGIAFHRYFPL